MEKSQALHCQNNLSKIGMALAAYLEDSQGFYPTLQHGVLLSGKAGTLVKVPYNKRKLNMYLDSTGSVNQCPSDKGDVSTFSHYRYAIGSAKNCFEDYGSSYLAAANSNRGAISYTFHRTAPKNIYQMNHLDNKLITADFPWGKARSASDPETRWHGGDNSRVLNVLFGDGHAALTDFTIQYEEEKRFDETQPRLDHVVKLNGVALV